MDYELRQALEPSSAQMEEIDALSSAPADVDAAPGGRMFTACVETFSHPHPSCSVYHISNVQPGIFIEKGVFEGIKKEVMEQVEFGTIPLGALVAVDFDIDTEWGLMVVAIRVQPGPGYRR